MRNGKNKYNSLAMSFMNTNYQKSTNQTVIQCKK